MSCVTGGQHQVCALPGREERTEEERRRGVATGRRTHGKPSNRISSIARPEVLSACLEVPCQRKWFDALIWPYCMCCWSCLVQEEILIKYLCGPFPSVGTFHLLIYNDHFQVQHVAEIADEQKSPMSASQGLCGRGG